VKTSDSDSPGVLDLGAPDLSSTQDTKRSRGKINRGLRWGGVIFLSVASGAVAGVFGGPLAGIGIGLAVFSALQPLAGLAPISNTAQ
jgi:hypothetical protein